MKFGQNYKPYYKSLFRLGLPVLVSQLGVITVSFADTMMVGAYGVSELAAAAFVNSLFMIPVVMQIGFANGVTPLVGTLFGRGEHSATGRTIRSALDMNVAVSIAFLVIMGVIYFFLDRFGQPEELLPLIRQYYCIILFSLLPMSAFGVFQQSSNGMTHTAMPMWITLGGNVLNIIGNYLLIFGHCGFPEMGLNGAGMSTLITRWAMAAVIMVIYFTTPRYKVYIHDFLHARNRGVLRRRVWSTSYPVMIQSGVECSLWSLGAVVCGWFDKIQLASYQVVNTMAQLGFMVFLSFGVATSIMVSNFMGSGELKAVRRVAAAGLHVNLFLATAVSILFIVCGHDIVGCFTSDESVIAVAVTFIPPLVLYQYGDAVQISYCNAIRGTSHVKPLLWIALISYIGVGVPMLFVLALGYPGGGLGVYYSFFFALLAASVLACVVFYRALRRFEAAATTSGR